jgi:hypothetical protein
MVTINQSEACNTFTGIEFQTLLIFWCLLGKRGHTSDKHLPISTLLHVKGNTKLNEELN